MAVCARVLVVAPDLPRTHEATRGLEVRGAEVSTTHDSETALQLGRDGVDVAVLFVPQELDVAQLCAALKQDPCAPSVLMVGDSASAEAVIAHLPESLKPDAVLSGGLDPTKLLFEIHELLREQQLGDDHSPLPISFAELLMALRDRDDAGVLEIHHDGVTTAIHLERGRPVFAEGGSLQETLGRLLVRHGTLAEEDYVRVVERMTEGVIRHESLRMGEVLVEMGLLSPAEVAEALALQVREKIVACFQWEHFDFELRVPDGEERDWSTYRCPPLPALILFGVRTHYGPDRIEASLAPFASELAVLRDTPSEIGIQHQMTAAEQRLLDAIDGTRTIVEVGLKADLDRLHARQVLTALVLSHAIGFRTRGQAPTSVVPPAHQSVTHIPRPKHPRPQAPKPASAEDRAARLQAEVAFNDGLAALREENPDDARAAFQNAAALLAGEPEYEMMACWAAYLAVRGNTNRSDAAGAEARRSAERSLEVAASARAHRILSWLARDEGDLEAAGVHAGQALHLDVSVSDKSLGISGAGASGASSR